MTEKRFHRDDYPTDILGEFGLTEQMIYDLPDYIHDRIELGGMSPLLPISIKQPFGLTRCYAKFCLVETNNGFVDVMFSPKLKEIDLSGFSESDIRMLKEGKVIVSDIEESITNDEGEEETQKIKAFVQIDNDTNCVVYTPTQIIGRNLKTVSDKLDLSDTDLQSFWKGGLVTVGVPDSQGGTSNVTVGVDLFSEKGVVVVPGDATRWKSVVRSSMPEYSFGNDGCWLNRNGVLSYVPEPEFTEDILNVLERQARQSGIILDSLQKQNENQHQYGQGVSEDEAHQITR